jgi:hypothetical protein
MKAERRLITLVVAVMIMACMGCNKSGDTRIVKGYDGKYHIESYYPSLNWHRLGTTKFETIEQAREMVVILDGKSVIMEESK